jgi:hypothetical protein
MVRLLKQNGLSSVCYGAVLLAVTASAAFGGPGFKDCISFPANQPLPATLGPFTFAVNGGVPLADGQGRIELGVVDITVGFGPTRQLLFMFISGITKTVTLTGIKNGTPVPPIAYTINGITMVTPNTENMQKMQISGKKDTWLETICKSQ